MDYQSRQLAEDFFLREPVDARIRYQKNCFCWSTLCNVFLIFPLNLNPFSRKPKEEPKEDDHPTLRVEMQTVRLNSDSQKLVLDTLRFIHGPDFKLGSATGYKVTIDNTHMPITLICTRL